VNNSNRLCKSNSCIARYYALRDSNLGSGASALNVIKKRIIGDFCCVCGYDKTLNYHHVVEKCDGGSDLLTNIVPLCPNHHAEVHYCALDVTNYHNKVLKRIEDIKNGLIIID
jgi:5-methylcytosine-specific restriction endonuclease McrA